MKLRVGEWTAIAGIGCTIASLVAPWYESSGVNLDFWDTFGGAAVLMLAALAAASAMVAAALFERESPALPVSTAVWSVTLCFPERSPRSYACSSARTTQPRCAPELGSGSPAPF